MVDPVQVPDRWRQRFETYGKCLTLLREAVELAAIRPLSELEKAGLVQRYKLTWEYGWKTLSDYLRKTEHPDLPDVAGSSIRLAAVVGLIGDSDEWLNAGKLRHVLTHEYSAQSRDEGLSLITSHFLPMLERLHRTMEARL